MKKHQLLLLAAIVSSFTIMNNTGAQGYQSVLLQSRVSGEIPNLLSDTGNAGNKIWNNISSKAIRDFKKRYQTVSDEQWYVRPYGFMAKFILNGITNRVDYDQKGIRLHTIRYYDEKRLPSEVRRIVKSEYYDYTITLVEEFETADKTAYLVHMQDATTWKNVSVCNGEMNVTGEWSRK